MKILYLIIIAMVVISATYIIQALITFEINIQQLKNSSALRNEAQATKLIQGLDIFIDKRIDDFRSLAKIKEIQQSIMESNAEFSKIEGIETFMEKTEEIYTQESYNRYLPFFTQALHVKLSVDLKKTLEEYKTQFSFDNLDEFFITNYYGANIVTAVGVQDYIQFDEGWWYLARYNGLYLGPVSYNEKYNGYSVQIALSVVDENGNFIGALSSLVDVDNLLEEFESNTELLFQEKKTAILFDNDGKIIFSNDPQYKIGSQAPYVDKVTKSDGFFFIDGTNESKIASYSKSVGYEDFKGTGWAVLVIQDSENVVSNLIDVRDSLLIPSIVGIVITVIIGIVISVFVTKPLIGLSNLVQRISTGDFSVKTDHSKLEEINTISESFNNMTSSLKKLVETEKELAETQAKVKNERLTAIGELSASIAHDMKNPLAIIKTSAAILKKNLKTDDPKTSKAISNMDIAISRISHQIQDVLNYVRTTPANLTTTNLLTILNSSKDSIEIPNNIELEMPQNDIQLKCDAEKLEIVFINLILNAIQAIEGKDGKITITADESNDKVIIKIQNTGKPIPEELLKKIFDPLVTTKYQGTGLGLSSCKNIIQQHKGTIEASNNPTTFTVHLPKNL